MTLLRRKVFLSLGSNMGDRLRNLNDAIARLDKHTSISVRAVSGFYETEPLYNSDQPDFLNCAAEVETSFEPAELLSSCLDIERKMGRKSRRRKNSPRTIDIDIIFFDQEAIQTDSLQIPHGKYAERRFVLTPLNDIAAEFVCPDSGMTVAEALRNCPDLSRVESYLTTEMT